MFKMKHLTATKIDFPDRLIKVKMSELKNTHIMEGEVKWVNTLFNSIDTKGMMHPILVCKEEELKDGGNLDTVVKAKLEFFNVPWRVIIGNNRYFYAVDRKYDSIAAYEVKTKKDLEVFHNATVLEAHQF